MSYVKTKSYATAKVLYNLSRDDYSALCRSIQKTYAGRRERYDVEIDGITSDLSLDVYVRRDPKPVRALTNRVYVGFIKPDGTFRKSPLRPVAISDDENYAIGRLLVEMIAGF